VFCTFHRLFVLTNCKSYCMRYATSFIPHDSALPLSIFLLVEKLTLPPKIDISSFTLYTLASVIIHDVACSLSTEVWKKSWSSIALCTLALPKQLLEICCGLHFPYLHLI
jgi:hypothetical protein